MKIRMIKPEFFLSEKMGSLTPRQRLLFIAMWLIADDAGILENKPRQIAMQAFPWDLMGPAGGDTASTVQCSALHMQDSAVQVHDSASTVQDGAAMSVTGECIAGLEQLERIGVTHSYIVDGRGYIVIRNFREHQNMNRPSKTRYPLPNGKPRGQTPKDARQVIDEHFRQLDATES